MEIVARRTIDGEGGLDAGLKNGSVSVSGRYLPTNAWAWKAVGVVELVSFRKLNGGLSHHFKSRYVEIILQQSKPFK